MFTEDTNSVEDLRRYLVLKRHATHHAYGSTEKAPGGSMTDNQLSLLREASAGWKISPNAMTAVLEDEISKDNPIAKDFPPEQMCKTLMTKHGISIQNVLDDKFTSPYCIKLVQMAFSTRESRPRPFWTKRWKHT